MNKEVGTEKLVEIVSLGVNCLPRTILTRGGVKPRKADGELSCPFDLVKHPPETVLKCLQNGFEGYFDDFFFVLRKRWIFDFRNKGVWQKKDSTKFFHDKDCKKDDLEKLTSRIKRRIENFNGIIKAEKPIVFVMVLFSETNCLDEIYNTLKDLRQGKPFEFVVISFDSKVNVSEEKIKVLELPLPNKKFAKYWNKKSYVKSPLGSYVEKFICEYVKSVAEKCANK